MKKAIIILLITFSFKGYTQTPIIDIYSDYDDEITGTYYKDINGLLNKFEGTYVYQNGNQRFKLILVKKEMQYNSRYYQDLIIGGYQYIDENGVELGNTLANVSVVYPNQIMHFISGYLLKKNNNRPICNDCFAGELRLSLSMTNPDKSGYATLIIRKMVSLEDGSESLKIYVTPQKSGNRSYIDGTEPPTIAPLVPSGEYILLKE
jgi:hypothetical protein